MLASASPRRRDLLTRAGVPFEIRPADLDEEARAGEDPSALVQRLSREKAEAVAAALPVDEPRWVLGADTIVVVDDDVLGKPRDPEHAVELLSRLVGRHHQVLTGVALVSSPGDAAPAETAGLRQCVVRSDVEMRTAEVPEIRAYVATGEPLDKAGAYALQGEGRRFVVAVRGSETNVIGLPVDQTLELFRDAGAWPR